MLELFTKNTSQESQVQYPKNRAILDVICPIDNFDFGPERVTLDGRKAYDPEIFMAGGQYRQIIGCQSFPSLNDVGWGDYLFSNSSSITTICCEKLARSKITKDLDTSIERDKNLMPRARKESDLIKNQIGIDHSRTMLELLEDQDESFYKTSVAVQVFAKDEEKLRTEVESLKESLDGANGIKTKTIRHSQRESFFGLSPLMATNKTLIDQISKPMPAATIGALLPFSKTGLDDGRGCLVGTDSVGGVVRLDMSSLPSPRGNINVSILGKSGMGKTTLMAKIMEDDLARGTRVIVIDPEREYRTLCDNIGGQWVNLGGSSKYRISPLRPRTMGGAADKFEDAEEIYQATKDGEVLSETVSALRTFFKIGFDMVRQEIDYLEKIFKEEYGRFGITYNTSLKDIDIENHPVMDDILKAVERKMQKAQGKGKEQLEALYGKLWPAVEGSFANLWNGKTNVVAASNFIVLDTHDLNQRDDSIRGAQYYNLMTWVWDQIVQARITNTKVRIYIDECHLIFNNKMDLAAQSISMIAKRIRKYNGGLTAATQEVADLNQKYSKPVLNQSAYKFLLHNEADDLAQTVKLFSLTSDIKEKLENASVGQCVVIAGNEKVWSSINVSDWEDKLFKTNLKNVA